MARRTRSTKRANSARGASWRGVTEALPVVLPRCYPASGKPMLGAGDAVLAAARLAKYDLRVEQAGSRLSLFAPGATPGCDLPVFEADAPDAMVAAVAAVESLLSAEEARALTVRRKAWRDKVAHEIASLRAREAALKRAKWAESDGAMAVVAE